MKIQFITYLLLLTAMFTAVNAQTSKSLPTVRGDEAIEQLKQTGQYDSLIDAVTAARKDNGQTDEPQTEDAVGQSAKLFDTAGAGGDLFGFSVAISGDTAIVGAYVDDVGANTDQGSAYVFTRTGATWTQQVQLNHTGGAANDEFGYSVSISGDKIIVGAPASDVSVNVPFAPQAVDQGAVFIFVNTTLATTAANVSVAGRVSVGKRGLLNATVTLTDQSGTTRTARTSTFGYYRFDEVKAGQTYIVSVQSKRFQFAPQVVNVVEDLSELNFYSNGEGLR